MNNGFYEQYILAIIINRASDITIRNYEMIKNWIEKNQRDMDLTDLVEGKGTDTESRHML